MKKYKIVITLGIIMSMLSVSACSSKKDEVKPVAVAAAKAANKVVEASGVVKASITENIVIDMPIGASPKVLKVNVKDGQKVKKGDKLAELDLSDYNTLITQKSKAIEADQILRNDMQTYNQKKAQDLKIEGQQVELNALKAKLIKSYISNGNLVSDMDNAVVSDITCSQGDVVNSQQRIVTLQDLNSLVVIAEVDEAFIKDFEEGSAVTLIPQYNPSAKLTGKVTRIYNEAEKQNGDTYVNVEISIDRNDEKLLPNYNVDIVLSKN